MLILNNFQLFCLFLMITSSLLYASIFGHVTTIIHNMTLAAAKYHDMLNNVREFMVLNEVEKQDQPRFQPPPIQGSSQSHRESDRLHRLQMDQHERSRAG